MLKVHKYEGKTETEAIDKCCSELSCNEEDLLIHKEETKAKLFKAKKVEILVVTKNEIIEEIKSFIHELGHLMNFEIQVEIRESEGIYNLQLYSDHNPILIGKDGRTIDAIQTILRQSINNNIPFTIKINVDASNYKGRKLKNLEREVKQIAREVLSTKIEAKLDPMNSYERRYIHNLIHEYENLTTESHGEGIERHIVISYVEQK